MGWKELVSAETSAAGVTVGEVSWYLPYLKS